MAHIVSINVSTNKGTCKYPVSEAELQIGHGIVGDAHAGAWHRQISLLALESIEKMTGLGAIDLQPGMFAENVTTKGLELFSLPIGTKIRLGECLIEITQIGKVCHQHCEIYKKVGHCIMPLEGVFARVITGGYIHAGDIIKEETP
jgi:MOSC domain-containing protein YiiM